MEKNYKTVNLKLPYSNSKNISLIQNSTFVISRKYKDEYLHIKAKGPIGKIDSFLYLITNIGNIIREKNTIFIEYEPTNNHIWLPRLLYCVSFIKHLCNIRNIFVLTPYQLYCELLKRGGQVIFEKEGESNGIHENTKSKTSTYIT